MLWGVERLACCVICVDATVGFVGVASRRPSGAFGERPLSPVALLACFLMRLILLTALRALAALCTANVPEVYC